MRGRRAQILLEVVDRYIHTRRPVSSQELVRVYRHRLSPATIRNELHALEEEGYLSKPHASAGRVPTVQGFRFFAQWLLSLAETEPKGARLPAESQPAPGLPPLPELLRRTALLLSGMTGELGFVVLPSCQEAQCLSMVLREIQPGTVLAATVSEFGVMEARLLPVPPDLSPAELKEAEAWLAARLRAPHAESPAPRQGRAAYLAHQLLAELQKGPPPSRILVEGWPQLLSELSEHSPGWALERLRGFLRLLQSESEFLTILWELRRDQPGLMAHVGVDQVPALREFALVTSPYLAERGILGVVGPLWMDYARAFSAVRYLTSRLQSLLRPGGSA
jgi:heat-inducible transcriptional repressor